MVKRRRFTNKVAGLKGEVLWHVRLSQEVSDALDDHVGEPYLPDRSAILQDAAALWAMLEQR